MRFAGIDIGSRSIELVVLEEEEVAVRRRLDTTFDPLAQCEQLLDGVRWDGLVATGYGRKLFNERWGGQAITEIRAHATGARHLFPEVRMVLDIGGQDTKAIALNAGGQVDNFEMNDRCAAGTGKFLEFMSTGLQVPLEGFGDYALTGRPGLEISSMCTVFAESEATSLMARGHSGPDIARALHQSIVTRSVSMLRRVGQAEPLVFTGGVARNRCVVELMSRALGCEILLPEHPDTVGALGAALEARRTGTA
jgi:predicted CoA-substrate-specific enzyme activase